MSENVNPSKSTKKESLASVKKSIWGEISATSGVVLLIMGAIIVLAVVLFVFLNRVPAKTCEIIDDAEIFTDEEYEELEEMAEELNYHASGEPVPSFDDPSDDPVLPAGSDLAVYAMGSAALIAAAAAVIFVLKKHGMKRSEGK